MKVTIKTDVVDYTLYGVKTTGQKSYDTLFLTLSKNARSTEKDLAMACNVLNALGIKSNVEGRELYMKVPEDKCLKLLCEARVRRNEDFSSTENDHQRLKDFIAENKAKSIIGDLLDEYRNKLC